MIATQIESADAFSFSPRPKRIRLDSGRHFSVDGVTDKSLDIKGVLQVLKSYQDYDGGINCSICGKLYKSRVCFIKHLWEHSVYWDQFEGVKNHERVLSIQAAVILYNSLHGLSKEESEIFTNLLVTAPNQANEKKEEMGSPDLKKRHKSPKKFQSPLKRKKSLEF